MKVHDSKKILILALFVFGTAWAPGNGIKWSGYLQADNRLEAQEELMFSWNEYRLDLSAEIEPVRNAHFYSEIWIRSLGFPNVQTSSDLYDKSLLRPLQLDLREAYLDLYGLLYKDLDLRIGRQRIAWGTGDKINPTDNLNPFDLEDIWDYGRHLGSDALKASLFFDNTSVQAVFLPMFTPSLLPSGNYRTLMTDNLTLPPGLIMNEYQDRIILPENNLIQSSKTAVKLAGELLKYDFSLSYCYGPDNIPIMNRVTIMPVDTMGSVDIYGEFIYPRMHIFGFDLAGQLAGVGAWAELAVFLPEEIVMTTDLSALGLGTVTSVLLENEPYPKLLLGTDYTLPFGMYFNLQYLHGFIYERGIDNLKNYLMFGTEWSFFNDRLKIMPLAGSLEFGGFDELSDTYAYVLAPEISYSPVQNAVLTVGCRLIDGKDNTTFGMLKDRDELLFKVKYSF